MRMKWTIIPIQKAGPELARIMVPSMVAMSTNACQKQIPRASPAQREPHSG